MEEPAPPRSYELNYEPLQPRRSYWMTACLSLGFFLFVGLVAGAWQLNRFFNGHAKATNAFLEHVHADGYPPSDSAIWFSMKPDDQSRIEESNRYLKSGGRAQKVEQPKCRLRKKHEGLGYRPDEVICFAGAQFKETRGAHLIVWKRTDGAWKIASFRFVFQEDAMDEPPA